MIVWFNLYKQGHYHRAGKPGTLAVHPGDLYPTRAAARADIARKAPYVGTFYALLQASGFAGGAAEMRELLTPYREGSVPKPLRETRRAPSHIEGLRPLTAREEFYEQADSAALVNDDALVSLETSEADAVEVAPPWVGGQLNTALGLEPLPGEGYGPGEVRPPEPIPLQCLPPAGVTAIARFFEASDAKLFRPLHGGYPGRYDEGSAV